MPSSQRKFVSPNIEEIKGTTTNTAIGSQASGLKKIDALGTSHIVSPKRKTPLRLNRNISRTTTLATPQRHSNPSDVSEIPSGKLVKGNRNKKGCDLNNARVNSKDKLSGIIDDTIESID